MSASGAGAGRPAADGAREARVVVLGARGMLGHVVSTVLHESGHDVISVSRGGDFGARPLACDATDAQRLRGILEREQPEWVVNCVGSLNTAVDRAPAEAIYVNSVLPHLLSDWGAGLGFRVVHVSTDCVFSGDRGGYAVGDVPDASSMYGRSKALGELNNERDLTVRTSIIGPELGHEGVGLLKWFVQSGDEVQGWTDARWTGLTTLELARLIQAIVERVVEASGVWQCVPPTPISKYELLELLNRSFRRDAVRVVPVSGHASDKSLINDRPLAWPVPGYSDMVAELRSWIGGHPGLYAGTVFAHVAGTEGPGDQA